MTPVDHVRQLQPLSVGNLDAVLTHNERWVPHVGSLDERQLISLMAETELALGAWLKELDVPASDTGSPVVCAEVNLEPPNPDSMAFHSAMGFVEVGRQWTCDDTVRVQLLERSL